MTLMMRLFLSMLLVGCGADGVSLGDSGTTTAVECGDAWVDDISAPTDDGMWEVVIMEGDPEPPDVGANTWTLEVRDSSGAPTPAANVSMKPWMPDHGHGTTPLILEPTDAGDGTYPFDTFDLFMPGRWDFHVYVGDNDPPAEALFTFCLEG